MVLQTEIFIRYAELELEMEESMYQLNLLTLIFAYSTFALSFYYFAKSLLPLKSAISRTNFVLFVVEITFLVAWIKANIEIIFPPTILRIILLTSSNIVYEAFYLLPFKGTRAQKFFVIMRSHFITTFIENLLWLLLILAVGDEQAMLMENIGWWSGEVAFIILLITSYWFYKRKKPDAHKQSNTMIFIQEMIIAAYFVVNLVLATGTDVISQGYFLTLSILLFAYFIIAERKEKENYQFQLNQQKYLLLEEHYEEMENYHEKVRIVKHDMKNHLLNLSSHLQQEDYPQVQKQLDQMVDTYQKEISIGHKEENV